MDRFLRLHPAPPCHPREVCRIKNNAEVRHLESSPSLALTSLHRRFATPNGLPHGFLTILIVEVGVAALARIARVRTHHIDPDYLKLADFCLPKRMACTSVSNNGYKKPRLIALLPGRYIIQVFLQLHKHLTGLDSHVYSRCRVFWRHLIQPSRNCFGEESGSFLAVVDRFMTFGACSDILSQLCSLPEVSRTSRTPACKTRITGKNASWLLLFLLAKV